MSLDPREFQLKTPAPSFDITTERKDWSIWRERWTAFVGSSGIDKLKRDDEVLAAAAGKIKRDALIAALSNDTVRIVRDLPLTKVQKEDADEIITALEAFVGEGGTPNKTRACRSELAARVRQPWESIESFAASLRNIAGKCKFTAKNVATNLMEDRMLDTLIANVNDAEVAKELLRLDEGRTFSEAVAVAIGVFAARIGSAATTTKSGTSKTKSVKRSLEGQDRGGRNGRRRVAAAPVKKIISSPKVKTASRKEDEEEATKKEEEQEIEEEDDNALGGSDEGDDGSSELRMLYPAAETSIKVKKEPEVMTNYTVGSFKKRNSTIYVHDGFRYHANTKSPSHYRLRCILFRDKVNLCNGTAKLVLKTDQIFPKQAHSHPASAYGDCEKLALKCTLREFAVTNPNASLRSVFDAATKAGAKNITFKQVAAGMYKARESSYPNTPATAADFCAILPTTDYAKNMRSVVEIDDNRAAIFFTDFVKDLLPKVDKIQAIGTSHSCPRQWSQLFTIFVDLQGQVFPAITVLMSSRSEELYTAVLQNLRRQLPEFSPKFLTSDFELASRNAFRSVFEGIRILGCQSHYSQCIWKKVQSLGLQELYKSNESFKKLIKSVIALAFLPPAQIGPTFNSLFASPVLPQLADSQLQQLEKLKNYYVNTWLREVGPANLSAYDRPKTNGDGAEDYLKRLKCKLVSHQPRIWRFMEILDEMCEENDKDIRQVMQEGETEECQRKKKKRDAANEERRERCKERLRSGQYTPLQFIDSIFHTVAAPVESVQGRDGESEDEETVGNEGQGLQRRNQRRPCIVCFQERTKDICFFPCRHGGACETCCAMLMAQGSICPVCTYQISSFEEVFLP